MGRVIEGNLQVLQITGFAVILAVICTCSGVSADNFRVGPSAEGNYTSIQAAVDAAKAEDTIFISPGTYVENLKIDKQVRIWSDSRKPEDTIIKAADPAKNTVEITGNRVSFSGFGIEGSEKAQILLSGANYCFINNNWVKGAEFGIFLNASESNTISDNFVTLNEKGIRLESSNSSTIQDNIIAYNYGFGISLEGSNRNIIYNNYFKNAENVEENPANAGNIWQSPLITRQNIVRGPYIGGNFWADLEGKGYSETSMDNNSNGICDLSYNVTGGGTDKFPLFPKVPNAVKVLENKLNSTSTEYEQGIADKKNETTVKTPVNVTGVSKKSSEEETPGFELGVSVLAVGMVYFLRKNR
jgi:parallel beta-helix repeat protein